MSHVTHVTVSRCHSVTLSLCHGGLTQPVQTGFSRIQIPYWVSKQGFETGGSPNTVEGVE